MSAINNAKPFLKWAGGKTQIIPEFKRVLPKEILKKEFVYIEPFVGSGAILFWMLNNFPNMKRAVINDINEDLINTYQVISKSPRSLISVLRDFQNEYHNIDQDEDAKKEYYYEKRSLYNLKSEESISQAALFIFLNRTCFNGLYRVNRKNEFNVPIGRYKKPLICDEDNILAVSKSLDKVDIIHGDFEQTIEYAVDSSIFYFDPPYKPLSETSSFNSYAKMEFDDSEQIRLKRFCDVLDLKGYDWILSNSDVRGKNPDDLFFDNLYGEFQIRRIKAKRNINANPQKRGELTELLITNTNNRCYEELRL